MKLKFGLILATVLSTSVMAQQGVPPAVAPTTAPATPPDATPPAAAPAVTPPDAALSSTTNTPAGKPKKSHKKKKKTSTAKKSEKKSEKKSDVAEMPAVTFMAGDLAAAKQNNINIRGQAKINSEVVGHLQKGDTVTVLEEVTLKHPAMDEPAHWLKITLPGSFHTWVDSSYIDGSNNVVKARKLNIRGGPGENYSVLGRLEKGDTIKPLETKGNWTQIDAPTNAFAFVAAHLLMHQEAAPVAPTPAPEPVPTPIQPTPQVVQNQTPIVPAADTNNNTVLPQPTPAPLPNIPPPAIPPAEPVVEQPLPKRIVEREGIVGGSVSIQAPSHFELHSLDNGDVMDYLYTTSTNVTLKRYKGLTVLVTGEEELDERWPDTPVLTIQRIQVVK
jgi:outer membrane biosynthesis protein TonB